MRHFKIAGRKIKLLPPPFPPEEDLYCLKCQDKFDTSSKRRACFDLCGHLSCFKCILKMKSGCVDCNIQRKAELKSKSKCSSKKNQSPSNILVLSSVLGKPLERKVEIENSDDEDGIEDDNEVFPEIQRLSLSELPVLECMPGTSKQMLELNRKDEKKEEQDFKPILINLEDDEEQELNVVDLDEDEDDDIQEVPVEEYTILAGDEERNGEENENGYKVELQFCTENVNETVEEVKCEIKGKRGRRPRNIESKFERKVVQENLEEFGRRIRRKRNFEKFEDKVEKDVSFNSGKIYNCKYCKSKYPSKQLLGVHMYKLHSDLRPFPCQICYWPFHTRRGLKNHVITHTAERPFQCDLCSSTFNRKFSLVNHLKKIHDIISSKRRKTALNPPEIPLDNQLEEMEEESFVIPQIVGEPYSILTAPSQISDIVQNEQLEIQPCNLNEDLNCPVLSPSNFSSSDDSQKENKLLNRSKRLYFRKKWGINLQRKKSATKNKAISQHRCQICQKTFLGKLKLANHLRLKHIQERPYSCEICGYGFAQKTKLQIHLITHTIDRPHKCTKCQASFNRKYSLERHVRIMHLKMPRKSESCENKPCQKKAAKCPYQQECKLGEFETRELLAVHLKNEHVDKRPWICEICGFPFQRKKHLNAHMKSHSDDKPFECRLCENTYNRLFSLERHMENCHGIRIRLHENEEDGKDEEEYCPECQSSFGSTEDCYKVVYSGCGHVICMECVIKADGFGCGQCTTEHAKMDWNNGNSESIKSSPKKKTNFENGELFKELVDKLNLGEREKNRLLGVELKVKRLEEMEDLGEIWSKKLEEIVVKGLKNHNDESDDNFKMITRRNGTKSCECPYCKMRFNEKKKLGEHLGEKHSDMRPFPCDICQWPFTSGRDLERHRLIHTNERPFKCNLCTVVFNRKSTRDRHVEKVHLKWKRI